MGLILTIDVGTTSVKTCLFDENFEMLGYSVEEYMLITRQGGIVEFEPEKYWAATKRGINKVREVSGQEYKNIDVITITTQGETIIPVDKKGNALRNAIVWLDSRAEKEASIISKVFSVDEIYRTTGLPEISGACPVSKVLWIKNNEPHIYERTYKFLLLEDFLILRFTGEFVTEKALISSTGYFDINNEKLWDEVLDNIGIETGKFPKILDCGTVVGRVMEDVASELGLSSSIVVSTGAMDQVASAVGSGNIKAGTLSETTGTALAIAATTSNPDYSNPARITIYRHATQGLYLLVPYCPTAGILLKWFKDEFCQYESQLAKESGKSIYEYLDDMAGSVPPLSNGLILLPHFLGMLTPESIPSYRGVFFGVSLDTQKSNFVRSILESVAFMLRENIQLLENMGISINEIRSLGGGSKSRLWSKIKADVNNKNILVMEQNESTSLGAAILGSLSVGMHSSLAEACKVVKVRETYNPHPDLTTTYEKGYRTYKKLCECIKPMFLSSN